MEKVLSEKFEDIEEISQGRDERIIRSRQRRLRTFLSIAGAIFFWWLLTATGMMNPLILPSPVKVVKSAYELTLSGVLPRDAAISMLRVVEGFVLAFLIAVPIGVLMGMWNFCRDIIDPLVELIRPIPPIAVIPLAMLWLGIGELSKVSIITYGAFFPILINTIAGFKAVDPIHIRAARTLGARRLEIFRDVILRSAFPHIVVGARLGMGMAFIVLVAAELIASHSGLGYLINDARYHFRTHEILLGMACIGILGFFLNKGLLEMEKRVVKWKPPEEKGGEV